MSPRNVQLAGILCSVRRLVRSVRRRELRLAAEVRTQGPERSWWWI